MLCQVPKIAKLYQGALLHWCIDAPVQILLGAKRKNIFWRHAKCGCWRSGSGASWMFVSHESCFVLCSVLFTLSTQIYLIRFMKQHLSCNSAEKVCPPTVGKWGTEGSFKSIYTWWVLETCLTCDPNLVHPGTCAKEHPVHGGFHETAAIEAQTFNKSVFVLCFAQ